MSDRELDKLTRYMLYIKDFPDFLVLNHKVSNCDGDIDECSYPGRIGSVLSELYLLTCDSSLEDSFVCNFRSLNSMLFLLGQ